MLATAPDPDVFSHYEEQQAVWKPKPWALCVAFWVTCNSTPPLRTGSTGSQKEKCHLQVFVQVPKDPQLHFLSLQGQDSQSGSYN